MIDLAIVGLCVAVALIGVALTALWQRQSRIESRVDAIEADIGPQRAAPTPPLLLAQRVRALEVLAEMRRRRGRAG